MDLAKVGDRVICQCKGGSHNIISGASTAMVDGVQIARVGDKSSCGAVISSGASWYPIEGSTAAIHGSATSCGGYIVAASTAKTGSPNTVGSQIIASQASPVVGDAFSQEDTPSAAFSLTGNNEESVYEYVAETAEVTMNQSAYLLVEGVGINGGYSFRNDIAIRDNTLHVSSQGWAPSTQSPGSGSAVLNMRAELKDGNQLIEAVVLDNHGINAWPDDPQYTPVGHATIRLPEPQPGKTLSLHFQGTFIYQTSSGSVTPMPPSTSTMISIRAVEQ
ncbi:MAG: PAAR domain-containing protein [Pseudomonadota bacterium]